MAKQTRTTMHPRHKMCLNTIGGVCGEQQRLYRLWLNGKIKSGEMTRGMFGLREIRCSLEAIPAASAPNPLPCLNVVEVPLDHFVRRTDPGGSRLTIEHYPNLASSENFDRTQTINQTPIEQSPRQVLEAKLAALPDKMLWALAGVNDDADAE